jgi:uncharacterized protein (TIGR02145 family)
MKKYSLIAFIGAVFLLCIFLFISSCKKKDKEEDKTNQIPTCTITNPPDGQQIAKGETVIVSVEATDADGAINEVQFTIDGIGRGSAGSFPYNYSWNTSDEALGVHTIKATAIDNAGGNKTDQVTVEIIESGDIPVAAFTGSPTSGTAPLTVNFTDQSTNNPTSWQWDFGDGDTSTLQNPAHTFNSAGTYTVGLLVSNGYGSDAELKSAYITVTYEGGLGEPCPGVPTVTDIDGNVYNTVLIGSQCWMKENLKTTAYSNGSAIPNVTSSSAWETLTTGAYVWYDNDIYWKDRYGALYNWHAIADTNGLCPAGWHVPTNDEWTALTDYIGGTVSPHGNELKSCRQVNSPLGGGCNTSEHPRWDEDDNHWGTDDYEFSGLPGGYRALDGVFNAIGGNGFWWSSTETFSNAAWFRSLKYSNGHVGKYDYSKRDGYSIRCLRD